MESIVEFLKEVPNALNSGTGNTILVLSFVASFLGVVGRITIKTVVEPILEKVSEARDEAKDIKSSFESFKEEFELWRSELAEERGSNKEKISRLEKDVDKLSK